MNYVSHGYPSGIRAQWYNLSTMKKSGIAAALTLALMAVGGAACGGSGAAQQAEEGPEGVVNYTRVDATVACAGATPPEAMAEIRARGFASVINFRTAGERGATVDAGQAAAEAAGLRYHHIPFREPSAEVAETFLATISDAANQPAFIHCGSANRVGAMWLIKRVKQDGWTVDDALAEAETIGLRSEGLREFALAYVRDGA